VIRGRPGRADAQLGLRLRNTVASLAVVIVACLAYWAMPYYRAQLSERYGGAGFSFTGLAYLTLVAAGYGVLLALYYLCESAPGESKSLRFWRVVGAFLRSPLSLWRRGLDAHERLAVLATLLKRRCGCKSSRVRRGWTSSTATVSGSR
jgi:hypothetical protein